MMRQQLIMSVEKQERSRTKMQQWRRQGVKMDMYSNNQKKMKIKKNNSR